MVRRPAGRAAIPLRTRGAPVTAARTASAPVPSARLFRRETPRCAAPVVRSKRRNGPRVQRNGPCTLISSPACRRRPRGGPAPVARISPDFRPRFRVRASCARPRPPRLPYAHGGPRSLHRCPVRRCDDNVRQPEQRRHRHRCDEPEQLSSLPCSHCPHAPSTGNLANRPAPSKMPCRLPDARRA